MNFRDQFKVYFVKPVGASGPIKIGLSGNPQKRINEIKGWCPFELEMIGAVPGSWADEQFLHECLAEHHSHGEWFHASPLVLNTIEHVLYAGGVWAVRGLRPVANLRAKKNRLTRAAKTSVPKYSQPGATA